MVGTVLNTDLTYWLTDVVWIWEIHLCWTLLSTWVHGTWASLSSHDARGVTGALVQLVPLVGIGTQGWEVP